MMKRSLALFVILSFFGLSAEVVYADSPHFVKGPTCTDNGTTLSASGKVAGLGTGDYRVVLSANGTASTICTNPAHNVAPGQTTDVSVAGVSPPLATNHGTLTFTGSQVTTAVPTVSPNPCPNDKWTPSISDVAFTSATISILLDDTSTVVLGPVDCPIS